MAEAYPLEWPLGRPRTSYPERSILARGMTHNTACSGLFRQTDLLDVTYVVLSTNMVPRKDGRGYVKQAQPLDKGVAIYFLLKGKSMVFACDRWDLVHHNVRAIAKTIEALRGLERWGTGDMVAAAFSGFIAIPESTGGPDWWEILGVPPKSDYSEIVAAFRGRSFTGAYRHPDHGGTEEAFIRLVKARDGALSLLEEETP